MPHRTDIHPLDYYNQVWDHIHKLGQLHTESCSCEECDLRKEYEIVYEEYDAKLTPDKNGKLKAPIGARLDIYLWRAEMRFDKKHEIKALVVLDNSIGKLICKTMPLRDLTW